MRTIKEDNIFFNGTSKQKKAFLNHLLKIGSHIFKGKSRENGDDIKIFAEILDNSLFIKFIHINNYDAFKEIEYIRFIFSGEEIFIVNNEGEGFTEHYVKIRYGIEPTSLLHTFNSLQKKKT